MTPDELRIRCATLDGWSLTGTNETWWHPDWRMRDSVDENHNIPDYCNSIDAINAAVLRLSEEKQEKWADALCDIVRYSDSEQGCYGRLFDVITASALDRATAYAAIFP